MACSQQFSRLGLVMRHGAADVNLNSRSGGNKAYPLAPMGESCLLFPTTLLPFPRFLVSWLLYTTRTNLTTTHYSVPNFPRTRH